MTEKLIIFQIKRKGALKKKIATGVRKMRQKWHGAYSKFC